MFCCTEAEAHQSLQLGQGHQVFIGCWDKGGSPLRRQMDEELLLAFLHPFYSAKALEMGHPHIGDDSMGWFGNSGKRRDFSLVVGPHLDNGEFYILGKGQQGEGHPNVVVQVSRSRMHNKGFR